MEVKCVESFVASHEAQLLTYLSLSGIGVGLLLNFQAARMKDGIRRLVV
ncbi:MAG: GxxExxY protein [Acetobacteraceae bacterium]